ncbi:MAG: MFS transporter [Dehalococcoidales bacterium]|nr:MFS transporter [Dehalococcoidales bacterium]
MIKKVFPILAVSLFSAMLGVGLVSPLLPLYAQDMGATGTQLGIIFAAYGISNSVLTPIMGRLSDRRGRKIFLSIGLLAYSILSLGYVWAADVSQLTLVRAIQGAAGAMIIPIAMAYIGDLSPEGEEGKWMGYANAAFFGGFGIGPLLGGTLTERFGMNASFYAMGLLCLLAFLIAVIFLPEIRQRKIGEKGRLSFKKMSTSPMVKGLFSFRLVQAIGRGGIMTFLPIFAATYIGLGPALIGVLLAVNMLPMMVLLPFTGRLADKFNRKALVILGNITYLMTLVLIPLANTFWQQIWLCFPRAIGGAISMPAATALTVEEGRKFGMGSTISILMMAMGIGMAIGPPLSGVISDLVDINAVFYFGATVGLIGTGLFVWFTG